MTLQEKKIIVDYLKKGDEVVGILGATTTPEEISHLLNGLFDAIVLVEDVENCKLNNDASFIVGELKEYLSSGVTADYGTIEEQLRMMADESESFENRIFEIGISTILEAVYEKYK